VAGRTIEKIYVFLMPNDNGDEGVITFINKNGRNIPAIATSEERMMAMATIANQISDDQQRPYRVCEYVYSKDTIQRDPKKT
jgi:predicted metalloprotease